MSTLKMHEKIVFERLFDRGGYVLGFSDRTYAEFFRENGINIDENKYRFNGDSKMKRLRAFWEIEEDLVVGKIFGSLLEYAEATEEVSDNDRKQAETIITRLSGGSLSSVRSEKDFLNHNFNTVNWSKLNLDMQLESVIKQRVQEIEKTLKSGAALATIFLCGSTLEGILQDSATKNPQSFNKAVSAPKDNSGKVRQFHDWSLEPLINTAHEVGLISLDVKKYSHALKDFRNYIHPRQQALQQFNPDSHTATISWQVLQAAIANIAGERL